jgi:hypothetical protein
MITFSSSFRKLSCTLTLVLLVLVCGAVAAHAQSSGSVSVSSDPSSGVLNYTVTTSTVPCGETDQHTVITGPLYTYTNFSYVANGTTYPLSGTATDLARCLKDPDWDGPEISPAVMTDPINSSCTITFTPGVTSGSAVLACTGVQGYVNPKYVVVGVTYAPPGPSTNTFVNYVNSTYVGNTTSTINTFADSTTFSVSLTYTTKIPSFASAAFTGSYATTGTQTTANTSTVTTSIQVDSGEETFGTGNYFAPVDNDFDVIWVWLNPVSIYTLSGNSATWNGYGYDATDQNGMDIVGIPLGWLNGDFGAFTEANIPQFWIPAQRTWAANQMFGAGQVPALTSTDLAQIASYDPFSVSTYGQDYIGVNPPSPSTSDNRFTLTECNSGNSISYDQASPSSNAEIATCTLKYVNLSTQAQAITSVSSQTYSVDAKFTGSDWFQKWILDVKNSWTYTTQIEADSSITNSTTNTGSLSVQGPPCNNAVIDVGPCIPVYDSAGNQPTQFNIYQDNMFGTFMFAPVHYY